MGRKRYKRGDRVKIHLNKSVSSEMIAWINKQSDVTNFFLYGAQQLFKQVGDIDVSKTLPSSHVFSMYIEPTSMFKFEVNPLRKVSMEKKGPAECVENKSWEFIDQIDCPFF
ncbi:hypothetical protein CN568_08835 [Bacillus pseudomycoides]|uniref:hypothetical protein n=1 Tax=Bacillus pseudomycoides TaxID=64104 RepID=UPI000BF22BC0|nr:hypothetical protein [Bacillus pseudomycoides]PEK36418.1 hypothetical protein CN691_09030 [Bacillus pseudomycoides]PEK61129.1 hypothetical protein CN593_26985 [Bacillus pseudomycoides]PEP39420.1 hypothetical protein CN565_22075 [Bacillus pseudomycoides]PEP45940.1 hypothetical protein CN568_08835 [Bacillus pseudomycoides]PFX55777.1 hypothetical protein COL31_09960 [Bacillus pseudomycoides]